MTNQIGDDREFVAWLTEGADTAPPAVVRQALAQAATARQRRELALIRRVHNMDGTAVLNQRALLKPALVGLLGLIAVIAIFGLLKFISNTDPNPAAPPPATRAEQLVTDLRGPLGTAPSLIGDDTDAITALVATTREQAFRAVPVMKGVINAATLKFDDLGTGQPNQYVASAITFESAEDASTAMTAIEREFRLSEQSSPDEIPMWGAGNRPPTEVHLPAGRDDGFERSGTYWAIGGTSANASNRAGLLNVWRVGDVVFVTIGVDWTSVGTADSQTALESGVMGLSEELTQRAMEDRSR